MTRSAACLLLLVSPLATASAWPAELRVTHSGPTGELAQPEEAREIRVAFSEPMVVLGRVPQPVTAPFFRIEPAVEGSFRWTGTSVLVFTPAETARLPGATRYRVSVDTSATSVAGSRLGSAHHFEFTTPTLRLLRTNWYRKNGRYDAPLVLALRFNQPVEPLAVSRELSLQFQPHAWPSPELPLDARDRLLAADPQALADFQAKRERTRAATQAAGVVAYANATEWDERRFPRADDLVVLETRQAPPTDAWIKVWLSPQVPAKQGRETPGKPQEYVVRLEPTFFVEGLRCQSGCDPEAWNPLRLRTRSSARALGRALRVFDVTEGGEPVPLKRVPREPAAAGEEPEQDAELDREYEAYDQSAALALEDAGYSLKPARNYLLLVDRKLVARDGQTLGYTWAGRLENWHLRAFSSFGDGHGVWESGGGPQLPFYARNLRSVRQWLAPLAPGELMPAVRALQGSSANFERTPGGPGTPRLLRPSADTLQSFGLDLSPLLSPQGTGLFWAALQDGPPIPRAQLARADNKPRGTLVQVTNLGIAVKDSPQNTLIFVTRLDDGRPVEGARVSIVDLENRTLWSGATGADGLALAPDTDLRDHEAWWQLRFVVLAEKDGDLAYLGSDWNEGVEPWAFGANYDLDEARPLLRGSIFADRGVYKLGEEVRLKAILRSDTARGIALLAGARAELTLLDSEANELDKRTLTLSEWSSADWAVTLPAAGPLGRYEVRAKIAGQQREVGGGFLVAAYRRPDFRVDANLAGESSLAGTALTGLVNGRYLFGAPMAAQSVRWTYSRSPVHDVPRAIAERFPPERYAFLGEDGEHARAAETLKTGEGALDAQGQLTLELTTDIASGRPWQYVYEGEVTDVSRQAIAGRASFRVDPAPWYLGLKRPAYFADVRAGVDTEVVAVGLDGQPAAGVNVKVSLAQVQWHSIRRAEGGGFYAWETERRELEAGRWEVTSAQAPVPLHVELPAGGYFLLRATAGDGEGRTTTTTTAFYVLGPGYTAWERYDHNRIDLIPERKTYRPGEIARLMVKSPWESASALLTTEREGVRSQQTFALTSTQQTIEVPLTEQDIPNLYVSVLLVKGRTGNQTGENGSDPGKPSFRLGYAELNIEDGRKRLAVSVEADREEYRPAARARVDVAVSDHQGRPAPAEVTLWAVDYGVLSLTDYRTPDVLGSVYQRKALQVMNQDSRQRIISRRAIVPKGGDEGGGGGAEQGPGTPVRKDFRVLAFWLGSLVTGADGRATQELTLPESLTTYRIMAVAGDQASRFGKGDREIRISKPLLLRAAFPRFLAVGDRAYFGAALNNQLKEKGTAIVTMRSLDPALLELEGDPKQAVAIAGQGVTEVRFRVRAKAPGRARIQMTAKLQGETDAFEETLAVELPATPEVVAAYGQAAPDAVETLELPAGVQPGVGGLQLELASTALVGLGEGARYLVDYPFGCAEQRASATLALLLAADLGEAFRLPGVEPAELAGVARKSLAELEEFQCAGGGFTYWKGECRFTSAYLTSYVLHVLERGRALGHPVKDAVRENAYAYLEAQLGGERPVNEGWWPYYTAWQAFAVKLLAEAGRNVDSHLTRLYAHQDRMPVFALAYLRDALLARGETGERPSNLERRIHNAILPEGGTAHVEELSDPHLLWFWNSNVRSTAIALGSLVRSGSDQRLAASMVRWLMKARKRGRWGNTQENALAMEALVDYYRKYEGEIPDFTAVVSLGQQDLARHAFQGRSSAAQLERLAMPQLLARGRPGERLELAFRREGSGTLHYVARLAYAPSDAPLDAIDQGFRIERRYNPVAPDTGSGPSTRYRAGDLVQVTLTLHLTKERRYVAVTDPLPAGFEPVDSWFNTTARDLAQQQQSEEQDQAEDWWERGGFDHVERHDDRVLLFATRLAEGDHEFSYVVRATTAGTFRTAPARAEEMYEPEVFGRTPSVVVEVKP